ncbi:hypothetical protein CEE44_01685 [Candidatus Woesearchaeota archaeon B3_Woes]|nr:MAG: hypothetical protein CEE44_01685 [Candidatus Woesearchaeota archaeon B3_Woes]
MEDISDIDYADAGVSLIAQNKVNARIKQGLNDLGLNAEGSFGGAVDISHLKGEDSVPIGIICASLLRGKTPEEMGQNVTQLAFNQIKEGTTPIALLDYCAGPDMNEWFPSFAIAIAKEGLLEHDVPTIGGESAEMPGTYKPGQQDAYVSLLFNGNQGTTVDLAKLIKNMDRPLLCGSTDGTGTKTRIVKDPRDIIYHGSNDLGAIGVKPVAFSLYVAGNVEKGALEEIVAKSQKICDTLGIKALDPYVMVKSDEYNSGQVDIAGTVIGVIDEKNMITGEDVKANDVIIGFATDCLMTNGYSLARKYLEMIGEPEVGDLTHEAITRELSKSHIPYTDILFGNEKSEGILSKYQGQIKATAHITGGGQSDNIKRMIPEGLLADVQREILPLPPIVRHFRKHGADMEAMYEAFNMGVGFTITVSPDIADEVVKYVNDNFRHSVEGVDRQAAVIGGISKN